MNNANNTGICIYMVPYYYQTTESPIQMQHYDYKRGTSQGQLRLYADIDINYNHEHECCSR